MVLRTRRRAGVSRGILGSHGSGEQEHESGHEQSKTHGRAPDRIEATTQRASRMFRCLQTTAHVRAGSCEHHLLAIAAILAKNSVCLIPDPERGISCSVQSTI